MNTISIILIFFALVIYITPTIAIQEFLKKHNEKIPNIISLNMNIFRYLIKYRILSKRIKGKVDILYYLWFIGLGSSVVLIIVAVLIRNII